MCRRWRGRRRAKAFRPGYWRSIAQVVSEIRSSFGGIGALLGTVRTGVLCRLDCEVEAIRDSGHRRAWRRAEPDRRGGRRAGGPGQVHRRRVSDGVAAEAAAICKGGQKATNVWSAPRPAPMAADQYERDLRRRGESRNRGSASAPGNQAERDAAARPSRPMRPPGNGSRRSWPWQLGRGKCGGSCPIGAGRRWREQRKRGGRRARRSITGPHQPGNGEHALPRP